MKDVQMKKDGDALNHTFSQAAFLAVGHFDRALIATETTSIQESLKKVPGCSSNKCLTFEVPRFHLTISLPSRPLYLFQWSVLADSKQIVFIEGEFYEDPWAVGREQYGRDALAKRFCKEYAKRGISCIRDLNGTFRSVIFSEEKSEALSFVDPLGVKTVYWHRHDGHFIFASDLEA